jgi:hypothetical protein
VNKCLSIKGAEDTINKPHSFEVSTADDSMYFIADSDKVSSLVAANRRPALRESCVAGKGGLDQRSRACYRQALQEVCMPVACLLTFRKTYHAATSSPLSLQSIVNP